MLLMTSLAANYAHFASFKIGNTHTRGATERSMHGVVVCIVSERVSVLVWGGLT